MMSFESDCNNMDLLLSDDAADDDLLLLMSRDESEDSSSFELDPQLDLEGGSNPDFFPAVLHSIVSDESCDDCIRWLPCGTQFQITDKAKVRVFSICIKCCVFPPF